MGWQSGSCSDRGADQSGVVSQLGYSATTAYPRVRFSRGSGAVGMDRDTGRLPFAVAQRRIEIGLHVALGAPARQVIGGRGCDLSSRTWLANIFWENPMSGIASRNGAMLAGLVKGLVVVMRNDAV